MITTNGIVGISLLVGALHKGTASFNAEGTATALATVCTLAVLCLVLPTFTTSAPGAGVHRPAQLAFAAVASLTLYGLFVVVQTVRHRDYFLPETTPARRTTPTPPSDREALTSLGLLVVALVAVVGLAKLESSRDRGRRRVDRRAAVGGRRRDRAARAAAGDARRRPQRPPRPRADELQPRARLGDGEHRPHDPRDRGRLDLARRAARARPRRHADRAARDHGRRRRAHRAARAAPRCRRAACTSCCSPRSCSSPSALLSERISRISGPFGVGVVVHVRPVARRRARA